ncbi:MAG: hypothetical protein ACOYEL_06360 [Saccharofermentanales bacterium]
MTHYRLSQKELLENFEEQTRLLLSSCKAFDAGEEAQAKNIAIRLRVLAHDSGRSKSLLDQLNKKNGLFASTLPYYSPRNLMSSFPLLLVRMEHGNIGYEPLLNRMPERMVYLRFDDWWNEIIFDDKKNIFSRKDIVRFVADQDGGAHVDPKLENSFADLLKNNSLGFRVGKTSDDNGVGEFEGSHPLKGNPVYASLRQIGFEMIASFQDKIPWGTRTKIDDLVAGVIIVDSDGRRFRFIYDPNKDEEKVEWKSFFNGIKSFEKHEERNLYLDQIKTPDGYVPGRRILL